jgi:hypothetical protein
VTLSSPPVPASPELSPDPQPSDRPALSRILDLLLRVAGGVLAVIAAVLTATLELIFATARVAGYLIGASVLLAILANVVLSWFAYQTVGRKWAVMLPAVTWFALMVLAAGGTSEGDILLAGNNWVGIVTIIAGSMAFAVMGFRLITAPATKPSS